MSDFIIFNVANKPFAVHFSEIDEIQAAVEGTPLPFAEPWHGGVANIRGGLYTIINLRKKFNLFGQAQGSYQKIILLRQAKVALLVDDIENTASIEETDIEHVPDSSEKDIFHQAFRLDNRVIPILHVTLFLASTKTI